MMARDYGRTDTNQPQIVAALRQIGATVHDMSQVGGGFPDLAVGFRGVNYLIEVKYEKGKLNSKQVKFFDTWQGQKGVARTVDDALRIIGAIT